MKKKRGILLSVLVFGVILSILPIFPVLTLQNVDTGKRLVQIPFKGEKEFAVSFLHSVNKTPVTEYYYIEGGRMILSYAEYSSFGAGMPEIADLPGSTMEIAGGILRLGGLNQHIPNLVYRVGTVANHQLYMNGKWIELQKIAPTQAGIQFSFEKIGFLRYISTK